MDTDYYTLGQLADLLRCKPYQIHYLCATRQIPEPRRVGGRRCFTLPEAARISELLKLNLGQELLDRATRRVR